MNDFNTTMDSAEYSKPDETRRKQPSDKAKQILILSSAQ